MAGPDQQQPRYRPETLAVRAGQQRSQFGEHSEALYLTSSFVFKDAAQAARRFSGEEEGNVYARFSNPTVTMFEERLAALEGAEDCVATASGMSAIMATCLAHLQNGDHIVASSGLFGATVQLFSNIMPRTGITTTFVPQTDAAAWAAAIRPETKLFFLETPSNPLTEIADIRALTATAHARGILVAMEEVKPKVPMVVRLVGTNADEGRKLLENAKMITAETLVDAAQKAVIAAANG